MYIFILYNPPNFTSQPCKSSNNNRNGNYYNNSSHAAITVVITVNAIYYQFGNTLILTIYIYINMCEYEEQTAHHQQY